MYDGGSVELFAKTTVGDGNQDTKISQRRRPARLGQLSRPASPSPPTTPLKLLYWSALAWLVRGFFQVCFARQVEAARPTLGEALPPFPPAAASAPASPEQPRSMPNTPAGGRSRVCVPSPGRS